MPEPGDVEDKDEPQAFEAGAGLGDEDGEAGCAHDEAGGIDVEFGQDGPEHELDGVEGGALQQPAGRGVSAGPDRLHGFAQESGEGASDYGVEPETAGEAAHLAPGLEGNAGTC